jgi:hypothetical protein
MSRKVKLPNGQFVEVTHIGTVKISESFILTNVLCVPSFSFNLISVSKLVAPQILIVLFLIYLFDNIIQLISLRSLWHYGGW